MKLGILGSGNIVLEFITIVDKLSFERVDILSTVRSEEKAKNLTKKYNLNQVFTDYDKMLATDIDTVYVALPNHLHYEYAKKALLKGKNVICEKPFTTTLSEFRELKEIAISNNLFLIEAVTLHEMPAFKTLKDEITQLGAIKIVSLNYSKYSSRYDELKKGNIMPVFDYKKSGGTLYDLNVYNVNFMVGLFGKPNKVHYYPNIEENVDVSGILILEYPSFKASLIGSKDTDTDLLNTIQGDNASIKISMPVSRMTGYTLIYNRSHYHNKVKNYIENDNNHPMYYEFIEFIRMIENNDREKMLSLLDISENVMFVLEEARKDAGINLS